MRRSRAGVFDIARPPVDASWPRHTLGAHWASLRGAESAGGAFSRLVWGSVLGFRLTRRGTPDTMVGWRMSAADPDRLVLDSDGRLMAGRMVFVRAGTDITWTTMLRFYRPVGRHIWSVAGRAHRELAPRCLDRARHYFTRHSAPSSDEASRD